MKIWTKTRVRWLKPKPWIISVLMCMPLFTLFAQEGVVETITYYSSTQSDSCQMNIYTPPGYFDGDTNHYLVLYLMHGGGENYTYWIESGQADTTLDYYIANEIAVPMIIVMPDGRNLQPDFFANEVLNEVIPYVESNYRAIQDRDYRGISGLSWGGQQSLELGIIHHDMFAYVAIMSSGYFSDENFNRAEAHLTPPQQKLKADFVIFTLQRVHPTILLTSRVCVPWKCSGSTI